jgi:hypothetical protein
MLSATLIGLWAAQAASAKEHVFNGVHLTEIYQLDTKTGDSTKIGDFSFTTYGFARQPGTGYLYYVEHNLFGSNRIAYWNPVTGGSTILNTISFPFAYRLGFDPITKKLWTSERGTNDLYTINLSAGTTTYEGTVTGMPAGFMSDGRGDLAFSPDGTLYMAVYRTNTASNRNTRLYTVDLNTFAASPVGGGTGQTGIDQIVGISFDCDGTMYACDFDSPSDIYSFENLAAGDLSYTVEMTATEQLGDACPANHCISGYVYHDLNHNGFKEPGENGLGAGVDVYVKLCQGGNVLYVRKADPTTGAYGFRGLYYGTYTIIEDTDDSTANCTPSDPSGWTSTSPNQVSVEVRIRDIHDVNFGDFQGTKITGTVFKDTGTGGGTANDGIRNGGEVGIPSVTVRATDGASPPAVYNQTVTGSGGDYALWVAQGPSSVVIEEQNLEGWISTGDASPPNDDRIPLSITSGATYPGNDFGDVPPLTFVPDRAGTQAPGAVITYTHVLTAGTPGTVQFAGNSSQGWNYAIYLGDGSGNPVGDATTSLQVAEGQVYEIVVRAQVPLSAPTGSVDVFVLDATQQVTAGKVTADFAIDQTTVSAAKLMLLKELRVGQWVPGAPGGATYVWTAWSQSGQARPRSGDPAHPDRIEYRITYKNLGSKTITDVKIFDSLSPYADFEYNIYGANRDMEWVKPDGSTAYLTAATGDDEGELQGNILLVDFEALGPLPLKAGESGTIRYQVTIR